MPEPSTVPWLTPWGYYIILEEGKAIDPLISVTDFNAITGSRWATQTSAVATVLDAVSMAIRNECGWHIAPNYDCGYYASPDSSIVKLPSLYVTELVGVSIDEVEQQDGYEWQTRGLIRPKSGCWPQGWNRTFVEFYSGYDSDPLLKQVVAQIATNHLAAAPGVREEQAGAVRITYNQTASGVTGGVTLLPRELEMISAYKLQTGVV